ncbi:uncharacterized protein [Nicotiana sylvestris]|uniref:uncharacterized protein n=1 Tax=Nicotiana sylvestris TaxID=4096 RepID=UPI00388C6C39
MKFVPDGAGKSDSPALNLPSPSIPDQSIHVPAAVEGDAIPLADIHDPSSVLASGPGTSDGDLRGAIHMLTQLVIAQAQRSHATPTPSSGQGDSSSSRINQFLSLTPPEFSGTDPEADLQDFLDDMYKTLRVMKATEKEAVELASYRLRGPAHYWFEMWEDSCRDGSPSARWNEFVDAFMDHFLPVETMASRATDFEILEQGNMSVWEYHMKFMRLSKYAPQLVPTMDARVQRFVQGLSPLVVNEAATSALQSDMNYGKIVGFSQATKARKLKIRAERESNSRAQSAGHSGGLVARGIPVQGRGPIGPSQPYAQSSSSAPPSVPRYQQSSHWGPGSASRRPHQSGRPGERFQQQGRSLCPKWRRFHTKYCYLDNPVCYRCGVRGHIQRDCRTPSQGMGRGFAQSSGSSAATSSMRPPAPAGRGAVRGGVLGKGGPSHFYALSGRQSSEVSPDVITGIMTVQALDCYALIDLGSSLSYVTPFIASCFGIEPEQLHESFSVSTPIGDFIIVARVYRNCVVAVCSHVTTADLIELGMVDFVIIIRMDWLYSCFAKLDCRTRFMRLEFTSAEG